MECAFWESAYCFVKMFFFSLPEMEVHTAKGQKDTHAHAQKMWSNNHNGTTYDLSKPPLHTPNRIGRYSD